MSASAPANQNWRVSDLQDELPLVSKRYRRLVYSLLGSLITVGIILSLVTAWSGADIRRSATPLLREQVPELRNLADLETAMLRYQLVLNSYFAGAIDADRFASGEYQERQQILELFRGVVGALHDAGKLAVVDEGVDEIVRLADEFKGIDRAALHELKRPHEILIRFNVVVKALQDELLSTRRSLEATLYLGSERTVAGIGKLTALIYGFAGLTVLTSVFMLYHARARFTSERKLAYQASHDPLTGLPHRRALEQRLLRRGRGGKVLVIGTVDRFDRIVGALGHARGDDLLRAVALRLTEVAEDFEGAAFSLDGATVALLFERARMDGCADEAIAHLRRVMAEPFVLERHEVIIDLTLGYACDDDQEGGNEPLLRRAGAALQSAMRIGGGSVVEYSAVLQMLTLSRLELEVDLRHAQERGQLELFYQPQLDLRTGRLGGFEALIRWRRGGQMVSPADFIPIAEESGLIIPMGEWILEQAFRQACRWNESGLLEEEGITVAVNLSMRQFLKADFVESVEQCLVRTGVDPRLIELEITESAAMHNPDQVLRVLGRLRDLGFALAIDDFGTGYSSLAYLQRFPLDKLKVDQSFVRELGRTADQVANRNAESIVRAMINLGHQLSLNVIAEGVETEDQVLKLMKLGCDLIQGYHYGKPVPASDASEFLKRGVQAVARGHQSALFGIPTH